jgi:hypothetical protein
VTITTEEAEDALEALIRKIFDKILGEKGKASPVVAMEHSEMQWVGEEPTWNADQNAIPVKIMDASKVQVVVPKAAADWTGQHVIIPASRVDPSLIASANLRRRAITIVNKSGGNVAIDSNINCKYAGPGANGSVELYPGDSITLETTSEIWAANAMGAVADIMVYQLFDESGGVNS